MNTKRQKKNVERDAMMIAGYLLDMSPAEMEERKVWIVKQSRQYIHAVEMEVIRLQKQRLMDSLG